MFSDYGRNRSCSTIVATRIVQRDIHIFLVYACIQISGFSKRKCKQFYDVCIFAYNEMSNSFRSKHTHTFYFQFDSPRDTTTVLFQGKRYYARGKCRRYIPLPWETAMENRHFREPTMLTWEGRVSYWKNVSYGLKTKLKEESLRKIDEEGFNIIWYCKNASFENNVYFKRKIKYLYFEQSCFSISNTIFFIYIYIIIIKWIKILSFFS